MEELVKKITEMTSHLDMEMSMNLTHGNKSAGARARKLTLELEKLFKEYRKKSVENDKR